MTAAIRTLATVEFTLPCTDDELDGLVADERFHEIKRLDVMEDFLIAAAKRYHALNAEIKSLIENDDYEFWPVQKRKAWAKLESMFVNPRSFLLEFFSGTFGYYDQPYEERKRMIGFAVALVECGVDHTKIDWAIQNYGRSASTINARSQLPA